MPTMIYAPGIKVYIESENHGTIDLSDDLTEGSMVRRSDGVSTFNFTIQNTRRKYDGVFTPNDRIVVLMKRLTWVQTFTGLLNSVPLMTAWPKVVNLAASCSLKRLQYWYWDPYSFAAYNLAINSLLAPGNSNTENTDGGLTNLMLNVLDEVVGWPQSKVHIGRIPADWFKIAEDIAREIADAARKADRVADRYAQELDISLLGGQNTYASGAAVGKLPTGTYGGKTLDKTQAENALIVFNVGVKLGALERDIVTALSVAGAESTWHNYGGGDRDSVGMFQQRTGWGGLTTAERMDPTASSTAFYRALLAKGRDRLKMSTWMAGQSVQISAFSDGSNYKEYTPAAQEIVAALSSAPTSGKGKGVSTSESVNAATGEALASFAIKMVNDDPHIEYSQDTIYPPTINQYPPDHLDCSMLVRYVYYHVMGNNFGQLGDARVVDEELAKCVKRISVSDALKTPGAVVVKIGEHIELSIGGGYTVGTNTTSEPARVRNHGASGPGALNDASWYDVGGLLPGIEYPNVGAIHRPVSPGNSVTGAQPSSTWGTSKSAGATPAPGGSDDVFNSIFGAAGFVPVPIDTAQQAFSVSLTGVRALLNDQPLLGGFLKNVVNASLRSFCSAPNGDFIAWFPDYYGLWGTAAKMVVQPIEVLDFDVTWSDDFFVTHQFTVLGFMNQIDLAEGTSSVIFPDGDTNSLAVATYGLANIDIPAIMEALFGIKATKDEAAKFAHFIYRKFGARPDYQVIDGMIANNDKRAEFFSALYLFMRQWAYQYNAQVPLTFMPELWPGMLLQIPVFDFQAYVTTVTHTFNFGQGGGFRTEVNLAAPARMPKSEGGKASEKNAHTLVGLPMAGGYTPGLTKQEAEHATRPQFEPEPEAPPNRVNEVTPW